MDPSALGLPLLVALIGVALLFDFLNGLHDAANSVATVVSTGVLRPQLAVAWAAFFNFIAFAVFGLHVARTLGTGIVDAGVVDAAVIFGALAGAIAWNLFTWWRGLPSSSSHALIGGLIGAAWLDAGTASAVNWGHFEGPKVNGALGVLIALAVSPLLGLASAWVLELAARRGLRRATIRVGPAVRNSQWVSSAWLAL